MRFTALAALLAFVTITIEANEDDKRASLPAMSNRVIAQFLERLPVFRGSSLKRFDIARIPLDLNSDEYRMHKRNNAEVVNHILKNFGALDRLGDVGRR
ncbi:hypothetical protein Tcan_08773 [Toxocara canis]|uniref:Uncharacterized protein n=1 Tax=Toxocara canis TaxID=6265 RepID=A0A0B2V0H6_TOXCA|nr:hypothetical protein Tcan_08773 [Toxocara canis]